MDKNDAEKCAWILRDIDKLAHLLHHELKNIRFLTQLEFNKVASTMDDICGITTDDLESSINGLIAEYSLLPPLKRKIEAYHAHCENEDYKTYLASDEWQTIREEVLERQLYKCAMCNGKATTVHHKTYANRGKEHPEDLVAVCKSCHEKFHQVSQQ